MSIGPLGAINSAAGSQLQQIKGADADRSSQESENQTAQGKVINKSGGNLEVEENQATADRDGDGRQVWQLGDQEGSQEEARDENHQESGNGEQEAKKSKDASGQSGNQLDLSG